MKEFQICYDLERGNKIYQLPAGNPFWYKDRFTAERILEHRQADQIWKNDKLYIIEREVDGEDTREPNRFYKGKILWSYERLFWDAVEVGEYVTEEAAESIINCLPPACMRADCIQLGEPQTSRYDEKKGDWRDTYLTIKRVADGIYEYCGDCFRGENKMRGMEMPYV